MVLGDLEFTFRQVRKARLERCHRELHLKIIEKIRQKGFMVSSPLKASPSRCAIVSALVNHADLSLQEGTHSTDAPEGWLVERTQVSRLILVLFKHNHLARVLVPRTDLILVCALFVLLYVLRDLGQGWYTSQLSAAVVCCPDLRLLVVMRALHTVRCSQKSERSEAAV